MKPDDKKPRVRTVKKTGKAVSASGSAGGKRQGKKSASARKKKRAKLKIAEKVNVALVAAVIILAVSVLLLAIMYLYTSSTTDQSAAHKSARRESVLAKILEAASLGKGKEPVTTPAPPESPEPESEPQKAPAPPERKPEPVKTPPPATERKPEPAKSPPPATPERKPEPAKSPPPATPERKPEPVRSAPPPAQSRPVETKPAGAIIERPPEIPRGALSFVIDDAGNNLYDIEPFLNFPGALTVAVLPGLPNSAETARRVRAAGKEVFLHQPMEAISGRYPGPGAIMAGMTRDEIRAVISRNLNELGPVAGINNHEGSRITMDEEAMEAVLGLCRERGLLFLDSRTTAETTAPQIARRLGMKIGERDIFIDNEPDRASMLGYINAGLVRAEQRGSAIMIGHAPTAGLAHLLAELYSDLTRRGFSFYPASRLINEI